MRRGGKVYGEMGILKCWDMRTLRLWRVVSDWRRFGTRRLSSRGGERVVRRGREDESLLGSVVKVFCTQSSPDYSMPWQNKPSEQVSGSGFVATTKLGLRILTNAHLIADSTFVEVRKYGYSERFEANVEAVAHECDVAILNVPDRCFWNKLKPLELAEEMPQLQDAVAVVGKDPPFIAILLLP